jgi:hypothetical protein
MPGGNIKEGQKAAQQLLMKLRSWRRSTIARFVCHLAQNW